MGLSRSSYLHRLVRASGPRTIQPEIMDELEPGAAEPALHDIERINRILGGHEATRRAFAQVAKPGDSFTVLDVGAASGDMGDCIRESFPKAKVVSLDYKPHHLRRATAPKVCANAFHLPFRDDSFDFVFCSLFLHHFSNRDVVELLRSFRRVARRGVIVNDLERHPLAYYFLPATGWLFGWNSVTLHDGPISVEAAFTKNELMELARKAGLSNATVQVNRPAFRLALIAGV
jgi:ubiquinone/menaquinone biosynthesis C-methylase UbiE